MSFFHCLFMSIRQLQLTKTAFLQCHICITKPLSLFLTSGDIMKCVLPNYLAVVLSVLSQVSFFSGTTQMSALDYMNKSENP